MSKLSELKQKYQFTTDDLHEPNPECKFCKGEGERIIKSRPDEVTFCICIFVDHDMSDLAGDLLSQFARKMLDEMNG